MYVFKHVAQFLDFMLEVVLTEIFNTCGIYACKKILGGWVITQWRKCLLDLGFNTLYLHKT